jgi:hypothetical protein
MTTVVNIYHKVPYDVFIGRLDSEEHFGNPFSHLKNSRASVIVATRQEAIDAFDHWLDGFAWPDVEPTRRLWVLANIWRLKGKILACYCCPKGCHGHSLARRADSCQ